MKACILTGPCKSEIKDMPLPEINDNEVLIRVKACGVCASELYLWKNGLGAGTRIMGHEPVGTIEAMGRNVTGFSVGDRITGIVMEAFAEYTKADYRNIIKVPGELDDVEALGEPLSCLISGAERTPVHLGDTVAIVGTGFMGLGFMQLMRLKGAGKIIAVDVRQEGLDNALRFGADEALFPDEAADRYNVINWDHMDGGVNIAVEASGSPKGLELAGNITAVHGIMSIVGYHQNGMRSVNMELWNWKAITIINAHERRNNVHIACMKAGLAMISRGLFNMRDMVTHEYGLEEVDKAYLALQAKDTGFIKAVIRVP